MSLDYDSEEWVPWYIRDSARWLSLSLAARGAQAEIIRKLDKKGRLRLRRLEDLAVLLRVGWQGELEPALTELLASGRVTYSEDSGVLEDPDFAARSRRAAAAERKRTYRARARDPRSEDQKRGEERRGEVLGQSPPVPVVPAVPIVPSCPLPGDGSPPPWWEAACDAASAVNGPVTDRAARWLEYRGARERKNWAINQGDAIAWISSVVRRERASTPRGGASRHVQSAENREWIVPKEMP